MCRQTKKLTKTTKTAQFLNDNNKVQKQKGLETCLMADQTLHIIRNLKMLIGDVYLICHSENLKQSFAVRYPSSKCPFRF